MNPFPFALADMRRHMGTVVAVVVLVAIAVALGVGISAQERAVREGGNVASDPFDLIIGAPGSTTQLLLTSVYLQPASVDLVDGQIMNDLHAREEVVNAAPIGFGDNYRGHPIIGTVAGLTTQHGELPLAEGKPFDDLYGAVIGAGVPLEIGDTFVPTHGLIEDVEGNNTHEHAEYHIVGRMQPWNSPWDRAILVSIESVWFIHGLGTGHESEGSFLDGVLGFEPATARSSKSAHADHVARHSPIGPPWEAPSVPGVPAIVIEPASFRDAYALRSEFRNRPDTTAIFPAEVLIELYALLGDATTVLSVVSVATQILVVGAVLLAVLASLQQKRQALGVLRALGAPRAYVFFSVWLQIVVMVTLGSLTGLFLGWGVAGVISSIVGSSTGLVLTATITGQEVGLAAILVGAGLILAVIPAARVYRQPVADVLRS